MSDHVQAPFVTQFGAITVTIIKVTIAVLIAASYSLYQKSVAESPGDIMESVPAGQFIDLTQLPTKGDRKSGIALIEISDFQCPFCKHYEATTENDVDSEFVKTGKLLYGFLNFPLPSHAHARTLATGAVCVEGEDSYWEMKKSIFALSDYSVDSLLSIAGRLGITLEPFKQCLDNPQSAEARINSDVLQASALHVTGTPTFALGILVGNRVEIRRQMVGALSTEKLRLAIAKLRL